MRKWVLMITLLVVSLISLFSDSIFHHQNPVSEVPEFNSGDMAWMIVASAFVLLMTPGLGFFYGGMVRKKNVISTIFQSFIAMVVITVLWVIVGFGLAFGPSIGGVIGNPTNYLFFNNVGVDTAWSLAPTIPFLLFALFQLKFAIITPAIISGGVAERIRIWGYILFIVLFSLFIYSPLAHMTWHPDGLLFKYGVLDFAGGTVVHMSSGWAALAGAIFLKNRHEKVHNPSRITYIILGTSLLWFGWFGFNAGSSFAANGLAVQALATTTLASASAAIAWGFIDKINGKKLSATNVCIGAVVGLVAITPGAGFVSVQHSLFIGIFGAAVSNFFVHLRSKTDIDDTLDVFPCHGIGGMVGMLLTGVFASHEINSVVPANEQGLIFGQAGLFIKQLVALIGVSAFAFGGSWILFYLTNLITPLRVSPDYEVEGLDVTQHGETL